MAGFTAVTGDAQRIPFDFHHCKGHRIGAIQHAFQGVKAGFANTGIATAMIVPRETAFHTVSSK